MKLATLHGSHGELTFHVASGHIVNASACDCEDCQRFGDYRTAALVNVHDIDPEILRAGGGDILGAGMFYRDGGYCRPLVWLADDGGFYEELPRLPAPRRYHWTDDAAEIAELGAKADAIEVAGCRDLGDGAERCDGEPGADMWSVYFHFSPEWSNDPNELLGALCIADRDSVQEARDFAAGLAALWGIPVHDYAGA